MMEKRETPTRINDSNGDGELVMSELPPNALSHVEAVAERVKGKPWSLVYEEALHFLAGTFQGLNPVPLTTAGRRAATETLFQILLTSLLEMIGADPRYVTDSFQAVLFTHSTREDFRIAGEAYVAAVGEEKILDELKEQIVWRGFLKMRDGRDARALAVWKSYSEIVRGLSPADAMKLRKGMLEDVEFETEGATPERYSQHPYRVAEKLGLEKQEG